MPLPAPLILSSAAATFASFGLGPTDTEARWMWRWDVSGLRFFRSWTGIEAARLRLQPLSPEPGRVVWQTRSIIVDRSFFPFDALESAIEHAKAAVREIHELDGHLSGIPNDRSAALVASIARNAPWSPDLGALADRISEVLPAELVTVRLRDRPLPVPSGLVIRSATDDGDAVRLDISDGSVLWLHQPWRAHVDSDGLGTDTGGALLWPGWRWRRHLSGVGAWSVHREPGGGVIERARGPEADVIDLDSVFREDVGVPDALVSITFRQPAIPS